MPLQRTFRSGFGSRYRAAHLGAKGEWGRGGLIFGFLPPPPLPFGPHGALPLEAERPPTRLLPLPPGLLYGPPPCHGRGRTVARVSAAPWPARERKPTRLLFAPSAAAGRRRMRRIKAGRATSSATPPLPPSPDPGWPASAGAPLRFSLLPRPPAPSPAMASPERDGQRDQLSDPDEQLDFVHQHKKFTRDAYLRLLAPYRFLCEYGPPPRPPSPARPFFPSPFGRRLRSGGRAQHDGHPPEEERAGQVRAGGQI